MQGDLEIRIKAISVRNDGSIRKISMRRIPSLAPHPLEKEEKRMINTAIEIPVFPCTELPANQGNDILSERQSCKLY